MLRGFRDSDVHVTDIDAVLAWVRARAELRLFNGGWTQRNPCKARSHHGWLGIEQAVVDAIAGFVKAH